MVLEVEVDAVPEVVVAVVAVVAVDDVSVIVPDGIAEVEVAPEVADASVPVVIVDAVSVDIVPVVPVEDIAVSVDIVEAESVEDVSVVLFVFSVLVQATTPKSATSARARKMTSDFFMCVSLLSELMGMDGVFRGKVTGSACLTSFELLRRFRVPGENHSRAIFRRSRCVIVGC